jgi:hypothetical protein
MNPTSLVLRWYRQSTGHANTYHDRYTAEEVLQLLRPNEAHADNHAKSDAAQTLGEPSRPNESRDDGHPEQTTTVRARRMESRDDSHAEQTTAERDRRSEAVRQVAARPAAWLGELTKQQRQEIGALADRLPSLVFHHAVGGQTEELVRRFGGWSTWRYERALEVAGGCIASHLNGTQTV